MNVLCMDADDSIVLKRASVGGGETEEDEVELAEMDDASFLSHMVVGPGDLDKIATQARLCTLLHDFQQLHGY